METYYYPPPGKSPMTDRIAHGFDPCYVVFPERRLTGEDAVLKYLDNQGITALAAESNGEIVVLQPDGSVWSATDRENAVHSQYLGKTSLRNVKLCGFGESANFIVNSLSDFYATRRVAGVFLYKPTVDSVPDCVEGIPAVVVGNDAVAEGYRKACKAQEEQQPEDDWIIFLNGNSQRSLMRVAKGPETESCPDALKEAWKKVFRYSCRVYFDHEYYGPGGRQFPDKHLTFSYEFKEEYDKAAVFEYIPELHEEGIVETRVETTAIGSAKASNSRPFTYYTWVPEDLGDGEKLPLVVCSPFVAGDAREIVYQSGLLNFAAQERFIILGLNWGMMRPTYAPMDAATRNQLVREIADKYHCDANRIFSTAHGGGPGPTPGSMGDNPGLALALDDPDLYAAVHVNAFPYTHITAEDLAEMKAAGKKIRLCYTCGVNDMNEHIPMKPSEKTCVSLIMNLNGTKRLTDEEANFDTDPYFGLADIYSIRQSYVTSDGFHINYGVLDDNEGNPAVMLASVEGLGHSWAPGLTEFAYKCWFEKLSKSEAGM